MKTSLLKVWAVYTLLIGHCPKKYDSSCSHHSTNDDVQKAISDDDAQKVATNDDARKVVSDNNKGKVAPKRTHRRW